MKKIVGILGIGAIALTMFFNTSLLTGQSSNRDFNLATLVGLSSANAEDGLSCWNGTAYDYCNDWATFAAGQYDLDHQEEFDEFNICMTDLGC